MGNRLEYVDIAKGIGIVLVVCCHTELSWLMDFLLGMIIPVFFFCAGYTSSVKGTFCDAMKKRIRKLFIPYVFFSTLLLLFFRHFSLRDICGVFYSRYCLYPFGIEPNIKFFTSGNYPMWFLTAMVTAYFFYYILLYNEKRKDIFVLLYVVLIQLFLYCPILLPWSIDTAFLSALFMYAGTRIRKIDIASFNVWHVLLMVFLYTGLRLVGGELNLSVRMYGTSFIIYFCLGVIGSVILLWISRLLEHTKLGNLFYLFGNHSLTIFCIQMIFIVIAKDVCEWLFDGITDNYLIGLFEIILAVAGGLVVSLILHKNRYLSRLLCFN